MRVLLLNGSTRKNGCGFAALSEVAKALNDEGIETEILQMGAHAVYDCMWCDYCHRAGNGYCVRKDDMVNEWIDKAKQADGYVISSPVYYAHPTGQLLAVLDRMFYAAGASMSHKPAAAIVTARRAGTTASLDVLNKYFLDNSMPIVSSTYWNMAHGTSPEQVALDEEGLQTMRNLGKNMAWMIKGLAGTTPPAMQTDKWTNFIR